MAKKKQFAGKKTKLAKLPLTQVLASQAEVREGAASPSAPPPALVQPLALAGDAVTAGRRDALGATFLFLVRELADLTSQLQPLSNPTPDRRHAFMPRRVPAPRHLVHALLEARDHLRELQELLSRP